MVRTYIIKEFFVDFNRIINDMTACAKKDTAGLYASIIMAEHDLRHITHMHAEDALNTALEEHNIKLGRSDIWQYAMRFDTNKVSALNAIINERTAKLKMLYPAADLSFELRIGSIGNKTAVELTSVHEEYFDYLGNRPYIKKILPDDNVETIFGTLHALENVEGGYDYEMQPLTLEDMISEDIETYKDKGRRIAMLSGCRQVLMEAEKLEGWKDADETENPAEWIDKRQKVAENLIDDADWRVILMERTGFNPDDMPDIKKSIKKATNPIKGIFMHRI